MRRLPGAALPAADRPGDDDPARARAGFPHPPLADDFAPVDPGSVAVVAPTIAQARAQLGLCGTSDTGSIDLDAVGEQLAKRSWFRLVRRDGPVDPCEALRELGRFRVLVPSADAPQFRRVVLGLLPMLLDPGAGWLVSLLGRASWRAAGDDLEAVLRLFWWTVEAGVQRPQRGPLVGWGAVFRDRGPKPPLTALRPRPWDPDTVAATPRGPLAAGAPVFVVGDAARTALMLRVWLLRRRLLFY